MKVIRLKFSIAKLFLGKHHRHNDKLQGHKSTYVMLGDYDFESHFVADCFASDLPDNILSGASEEFGYVELGGGTGELYCNRKILGILSIGRPVGRFKDENIHEITRICFADDWDKTWQERKYPSLFLKLAIDGYKTLYPDAKKLVTYIRDNESGSYLKHAGLKPEKFIKYCESCSGWNNRPNRKKSDLTNKIRFAINL